MPEITVNGIVDVFRNADGRVVLRTTEYGKMPRELTPEEYGQVVAIFNNYRCGNLKDITLNSENAGDVLANFAARRD